MDPVTICCIAIIVVLILLILTFVYKLTFGRGAKKRPKVNVAAVGENRAQQPARAAPIVVGGRRQAAAAAVRRRPAAAAAAAAAARRSSDDDNDDDDDYEGGGGAANSFDPDDLLYAADGSKLGKKKAAKMQAKAEKRAQREAELEDREDRKRREAERAELSKKRDEEEKRQELLREDQERKRKEEQLRRENEEYLQMKQAFQVEQEGFDVDESQDAENMLQEFVDFIKKTKVVNVDELAAKYKLRTQDVVERIKTLLAEKILTGVMDDRGKFIYVTEQELKSVAKFINQRGRVSVSELVDYSNKLIDLEPPPAADHQNLIETTG